jgi:hypothetical protein
MAVTIDEKLLSALIGAGVASLGWVVTFFQQQFVKSREERKEFLRRQVEEFYDPLLALIQKKLHVQAVQDQRLIDETGAAWVTILQHFEDNFTVPLMQQIGELLRAKPYLAIDWPASFDQYLRHESQSVALYQLWRKTGIPGQIETEPWPSTLEGDVKNRKERLELELKKSYGIKRPQT